MALRKAPGVLAVEVDYSSGEATIGTESGQRLSKREILSALESIGYRGEFTKQAAGKDG